MTNLTMSMFASAEDYWKARSYLNEQIVADVAKELGCERDNEDILMKLHDLKSDAALGRSVRSMPSGYSLRCGLGNFTSDGSVRWSVGNDFRSTPWGETPESVLQEAGLMEAKK